MCECLIRGRCRFECLAEVCVCAYVRARVSAREDIFESDKLKSHDVLKVGAKKKGSRERGSGEGKKTLTVRAIGQILFFYLSTF